MDRYVVIGHPIGHSQSPFIHSAFARQCGEALEYDAVLAPLDDFAGTVRQLQREGVRGANITVPFKLEAHALAHTLSERARMAGAVNTLRFDADGQIYGDNTDGAGLVRDLSVNHGTTLGGRRILLLGAGGAARGALLPLLQGQPAQLTIANRSAHKAHDLAREFAPLASGCEVHGAAFDELNGAFDIVINATSASLAGEVPPLPAGMFAPGALAYDMMYGAQDTAFIRTARASGAAQCADGLGMLVEQAAESFYLWRGIRPDTAPVLAALRARLRQK